jgi:hypothetical protein
MSAVLPAAGILDLVHVRSTMVCHLYHPESDLCAALDLSLERLAARHPGTRWVRGERRACGEVLTRLRLEVPEDVDALLLLFRDGCLVDYTRGVARFGRGDEVYEDVLEQWLGHAHVLESQAPPVKHARELYGHGAGEQGGRPAEEGEEEYYDCGKDGCRRTFYHTHVGVGDVPNDFVKGAEATGP